MMKCRFACLSTRNSILPPLISSTARATSMVTVPVFGFGIRPRGPRIVPSPPPVYQVEKVLRSDVVGAGRLRLGGAVTGRESQHAGGLAGAVRQVHGAADHLVGLPRVDAEPEGALGGGACL